MHFLLTGKSQKPKCCTASDREPRGRCCDRDERDPERARASICDTHIPLRLSPSSSFEIRLISDIPCSSPKSGTEPYKSEGERAGSPSNATWILGGETASQREGDSVNLNVVLSCPQRIRQLKLRTGRQTARSNLFIKK